MEDIQVLWDSVHLAPVEDIQFVFSHFRILLYEYDHTIHQYKLYVTTYSTSSLPSGVLVTPPLLLVSDFPRPFPSVFCRSLLHLSSPHSSRGVRNEHEYTKNMT